jgi:hypothetical protein
MRKVKIVSRFHNTEAIIAIQDEYFARHDDPEEALRMLDYEIYIRGKGAAYAKKKLGEIKRKLCGHKDCRCVFNAEAL